MILTPEDIRRVRPVAENINDKARLETYIHEAETLRLVDAIGASLYRWFDEGDFSGNGPFEYQHPNVGKVIITKDDYNIIMYGGYFDACCGSGRTEGLKNAIAYLTYSRFTLNNPINNTAFGVRYKDGEFSTRVEDTVLVRNSNEARKIGEAYLDNVLKCLKAFNLLDC